MTDLKWIERYASTAKEDFCHRKLALRFIHTRIFYRTWIIPGAIQMVQKKRNRLALDDHVLEKLLA